MKLVATKSYDCGGRSLKCGDEFEASKELAKALMSLGRATASEEHVTSEESPIVEKKRRGRPPGKRNTYSRRDLRAEE